MKKLTILLISFFVMTFFSGCNKSGKNKKVFPELKVEINETARKSEASDDNLIENTIEIQNERVVENPLRFYKRYDFSPIDEPALKLVSMELIDESILLFSYGSERFLEINDIGFSISSILNQCTPYNDDRLVSSSFHIQTETTLYYGIINFVAGYIKIFEWTPKEHLFGWPYYSGISTNFVIEYDWISNPEHYDYKKFETVPAEYDGVLLLIDIDTNEIVYSIDKTLLHKTVLLSIDKIQYEPDGFRITIGNFYDSDEYTDFKLFTDDNNFRYEIYDSYTYPVYDSSEDEDF